MIWQHALVIFIMVGVPLFNVYGLRRLKKRSHASSKILTYVQTMAVLWGMVGLIWVNSPTASLLQSEHTIKLNGIIISTFILSALYLIMVTIAPLFLLRQPTYREQMQEAFQARDFIMPVTAMEQTLFVAVAISVGICEEIIFRSFLTEYFVSGLFVWPIMLSVVVSALIFGYGHFHQGLNGMINATVFAYVMSLLFMMTGSLLLPIFIHIVYDLRILILAKANRAEIVENHEN